MSNSSFISPISTTTITDMRLINLILATPTISVASGTDGDIWYQASGKVARLAKGTSNYKLYMNAAGDAPLWGPRTKFGSLTRDVSAAAGDVSYTGVGFKPTAIMFMATHNTLTQSIGMGMGATSQVSTWYQVTAFYTNATVVSVHSDDASWSISSKIKSMDADGFTLTWGKTGTPTGTKTHYYVCWR